MADPNVGQVVASAYNRVVGTKPEDNIFADLWFFDQMTTKNGGLKKVAGGNQIEVPLMYATNTTFRSITEMEAVDVQQIDVFDAAQYDWKEHAGSLTYSVMQDFKASGDTAKFDLIAALIDNAIESHKTNLNTSLLAVTSGNNISGLQSLVPTDPTTGIVGTINRANFSFWRSQTTEDTGTSFNTLRANMRNMYNKCSGGVGGDHPTFGMTTQTVFEGYEGLLEANERFMDKKTGEGAFKNEVLSFKGMKLSYDASCLAAAMYFLNPKYLKLYVAQDHFMELGKEQEPVNQFIRVRKILTIAQLVVTQSRRLGVIWSIA